MNHRIILIGIVSILFVSCGPKAPAEKEVFDHITGNYCAEGYRLELRTDSSFFNMRVTPGGMGRKPLVERCEGTWSLVFDETKKEWTIDFKKTKKGGFSMASCTGKIPVWSGEKGWISGDSTMTIPEWFDKTAVTKGACEI